MGTLGSLLDLTRSALAADQTALNATSSNVANQNTVGYTRQAVHFQSGVSVSLSNGSVTTDNGPAVTTNSVRDRVLEQRVQQGTQAASSSAALAGVYSDIENVFSITGSSATAGSTQIGTALNSFLGSLATLGSSPSDAATRAGVLGNATALASAFNTASAQLGSVQTGINAELTSSVSTVNSLTATIAQLNKQIGQSSPNGDAGTLEDQRQTAIAQLSQYVGLNQITTDHNGITLTTTGGSALVVGDTAYRLTAVNTGGTTAIANAAGSNVSGEIAGGSIGGQLQAQNHDLPAVTSALDEVAYRVATAVNAQNQAGVDANGNQGAAIFAVGASAAGAAHAIAVVAGSGSALAAAGVGEGSLGSTNANALGALANVTDSSGETFGGQFATLIGQVGTASAGVQEQNASQAATLQQVTTQRDSLSGVSLDQEAASLTQFQQSYDAAAKVFSILNTLLTASINLGEQTTYS